MARVPGGYLGTRPASPSTSSAVGVWSLGDHYWYKRNGTWPSPSVDPSFANVQLLLHMNGTNGSTTFTDSSGTPKTVTAAGGAQISTTQSKFGGASGSFDGTGDYLTATGAGLAVGSGNFTIEGWFYFNSLQTGIRTLWAHRSTNTTIGGALLTHSSGALSLYIAQSSISWQVLGFSTGLTVSTATWHHIALVRDGNTIRTFLDGAAGSTTTFTGAVHTSGDFSLMAGAQDGTQEVDGYCDDFRLTTVDARYTAAFDPPTAPFPDA